ncbi:Miro-like family protein [Brugia pahangi]
MRNAHGRHKSIYEISKCDVTKSSVQHKRGNRALSVGSQHRSLQPASAVTAASVSELASSMPLFQDELSFDANDHSTVSKTKTGHVEYVSYQIAHPAAISQTLERKPSVSTQVLSALIGNSAGNTYSRTMGKVMRVLVAGSKKVGKTACLEQLACLSDITDQPYVPTIEDTYQVQMDYGDRSKEIMVFHDTAGISESGPIDLKRSYIQVADAFLLIYSVVDHETFNRMDMLKKTIDKQFGKDKKEVPIVVLGNMIDLPGRKVDSDFARSWAAKEKVKLYEVTAKNRNTLVDLVIYLGSRHFHSQRESKFSLSKKLKAEKSNAAIMMDL